MTRKTASTRGLSISSPTLPLEFVNTEGMDRNSPPDRLNDLELFLDWAVQHDLIDEAAGETLRRGAVATPVETDQLLERARRFREALYRIFAAAAAGRLPAKEDAHILELEIADALPSLRLVWDDPQPRWSLCPDSGEGLGSLLRPIAVSAADLLRSELLDRVKQCSSDTCSWMFIDESRNRSRRWCDMSDCGNRAKARRYYRRHVKGEPG